MSPEFERFRYYVNPGKDTQELINLSTPLYHSLRMLVFAARTDRHTNKYIRVYEILFLNPPTSKIKSFSQEVK